MKIRESKRVRIKKQIINMKCECCNSETSIKVRIKKEEKYRRNCDLFNTINLCRTCSNRKLQYSWPEFISRNKHIYQILRSKKWHLQDVLGVTKLVRYAKD